MGFFSWFRKKPASDPVYSVMNEDHVRLYQILGELRQAVGSRGDSGPAREGKRQRLLEVAGRLIEETREHFLREEALMILHGYAGTKAHKAEHRMLFRNIRGYYSRLETGKAPITEDISQFFKTWLTEHIRGTDRELERFLFAVNNRRDIQGQFAAGHTDTAHFAAMVEKLRAAGPGEEPAG